MAVAIKFHLRRNSGSVRRFGTLWTRYLARTHLELVLSVIQSDINNNWDRTVWHDHHVRKSDKHNPKGLQKQKNIAQCEPGLTLQILTEGIKSVHKLSRGELTHTHTHTHTENTHLRQNKYPKTTTPEFVYSLLSEERVHWGLVIKFTFWTETSFANSCRLTTTAADRHIQSKDELTLNNMIKQQVMTLALDGIIKQAALDRSISWILKSIKTRYEHISRHRKNDFTFPTVQSIISRCQTVHKSIFDFSLNSNGVINFSETDYNSAISPSAFEQKWLENILCWWLPARLL